MKKEYEEDIRNALKVLKNGGVILYPTDTVWGLGCDPANADAVRKIGEIKKRVDKKGMIILVNSVSMLTRYVADPPEVALQMAEWSETPLTVIYDRGRGVAEGVAADDGSLAVRLCSDPFCDDLMTAFRRPLVSTSANVSGTPARPFLTRYLKRSGALPTTYASGDRMTEAAQRPLRSSKYPGTVLLRYCVADYFILTLPEPETDASIFGLPE